jgi:NAD(P)H-flavin reductase
LTEKKVLSHNTAVYRFGLPSANSILGLPIGQHISLAATLPVKDPKTEVTTNKEILRSYTPITDDTTSGHFDVLVKSYPTGNISRHLSEMKIGDTIKVKGPKGAMAYQPNMVSRFAMIAGGTGITPMYQISKAILRGRASGDKTEVDLIFANVNPEDILMKDELDSMAREDSGFRVHYVLNNPPEGWTGGVGFVTPDMIKVRNIRIHATHRGAQLTDTLTGKLPCSLIRHEDAYLRTSSHGRRHEEGCRGSRLREGQTCQQAPRSSLLLLSNAIDPYSNCAHCVDRLWLRRKVFITVTI